MPFRAATLPLLYVDGRWGEARELATITQAEGSPLERHMSGTYLGQIAEKQGDPDIAWKMVRELVPRGPDSEPEDTLFPYAVEAFRLATRLSLSAGNMNEAIAWLETHDRWIAWNNAVRGKAESACLWASVCLEQGEYRDAHWYAERAISLAKDPYQPLALAAAHFTLAEVEFRYDHIAPAQASVDCGISIAASCSTPWLQARGHVLAASIAERHSNRELATHHLTCAREYAEALSAQPLLDRIDHLTQNLKAEPTSIGDLTSREIDVLRLVAEGMTDAEVGQRLFISPRTVSQHLRSIYSKLGISSRTQATRIAIQHDLT